MLRAARSIAFIEDSRLEEVNRVTRMQSFRQGMLGTARFTAVIVDSRRKEVKRVTGTHPFSGACSGQLDPQFSWRIFAAKVNRVTGTHLFRHGMLRAARFTVFIADSRREEVNRVFGTRPFSRTC